MNVRIELFRWWLSRKQERLVMWVAWKMPRRIVYWCVVRAACKVEPNYSPADVPAIDLMRAMSA